ncbi:MAG TPA: threonine synthase [Actinomycetota bacterium]|nr:threonine synthase [Actinomycetota bacterium]
MGATVARVLELRCRECKRTYPVGPVHVCEFCFGPLEPVYDYEAIAATVSRESIAAGPQTVWRYAPLLPVDDGAERVDLGTGCTPLIRAGNLAAELGIRNLYLKNDMANPTHSFKDRVVTIALTAARAMGFTTVACASTGNLANAVAAHAARVGLRAFVFIPADLEAAKVMTTAVYGANVVAVKGNYDQVNRLCSEIAQTLDWAFVNVNLRPFYSEGSKTLAFEVVEQLGWEAPEHVVVPAASGSLLTKIHRGLAELHRVGLLPSEPTTSIHLAQAAGCSPIVTAFRSGTDHIRPVKPDTIAKSLAIGNPADGFYAARVVRKTEGTAEAVTDDEIIAGIRLLASTEGLFTETAGGVTVAALERMAAAGAFSGDERVVALITGMGLKTAEALTGRLGPTVQIQPDLEAFQEALGFLEDPA